MDQLDTDTIHLSRIHADVADEQTTFRLINRYNADSPFAHLGFRAGQWFEITEDVYWYFLEVLPPSFMGPAGFVNCECVTHNLYDGFVERRGRYFNVVTVGPNADPFTDLAQRVIAEAGL